MTDKVAGTGGARAGAGSRAMAAIFAAGLGVRLVVIAAGPDFLPSPDRFEYQRIAENVLRGAGFSSAAPGDSLWHPRSWRTPGYPLFIAAHHAIAGRPAPQALFVSQAVIDAATALLVVLLGRRVVGRRAAQVAGWLYALHPLPAIEVVAIGTEALAAFLLNLFLLLAYRMLERPGFGRGGLAGVAFGADLLVRPTPQLFLPVVLALVLVPRWAGVAGRATRGRRAAAAVALALGTALVVAPWAMRNARVHGHLVPLSTLGGVVLNEGVGGVRIGDWWSMPGLHSIAPEDWRRWRELGEVEGERYMRERALTIIRERPGTYILSAGAKLVRFWLQVSAGYGRLSWRSWAVAVLQGATLALAAFAFLRHRGPWVAAGRLLWLFVLYQSALYALTVAEVRYSYVLLPAVLLPVAVALARLRARG